MFSLDRRACGLGALYAQGDLASDVALERGSALPGRDVVVWFPRRGLALGYACAPGRIAEAWLAPGAGVEQIAPPANSRFSRSARLARRGISS